MHCDFDGDDDVDEDDNDYDCDEFLLILHSFSAGIYFSPTAGCANFCAASV